MKVTDEQKAEIVNFVLRKLTDYDFSHYSSTIFLKRVQLFVRNKNLSSIEHLIKVMLSGEESLLAELVQSLTIVHSSFFRNPDYYKRLFYSVLPQLDAHRKIKIWCLGCAQGQEPYSIAMLCRMAGMLDKVRFYCTDINEAALAFATRGIFPLNGLAELRENFNLVGLNKSFSPLDDIWVENEMFGFKDAMGQAMHFEKHNILTGGSLGKMQLVCCRNVLIYMSEKEQKRIIAELLIPSLTSGGYLMLGSAENIDVKVEFPQLSRLAKGVNIFRKN